MVTEKNPIIEKAEFDERSAYHAGKKIGEKKGMKEGKKSRNYTNSKRNAKR